VGSIIEWAGRAEPILADPGDVGRELKLIRAAMKRLEAREAGLTEQAKSLLASGKNVAGWHIERPPTPYAWLEDVTDAELEMMSQQLFKPRERITPTQAVDRKLISKETREQFAKRGPDGFRLVEDNAKYLAKIFAKQ
jgi:hypothetical protein